MPLNAINVLLSLDTCAGPIAAAVVIPLIIIMIVIAVAIPFIILTPKKIRRGELKMTTYMYYNFISGLSLLMIDFLFLCRL